MPVDIRLVRDGRATLTVFTDPLDMHDVADANAKAERDFLNAATHPIHAVIDCTAIHGLPSNIISNSVSMTRSLHPMTGEMVIVVKNTFISAMANVLRRAVTAHKISVYPTTAEAWRYIDALIAKENAQPSK